MKTMQIKYSLTAGGLSSGSSSRAAKRRAAAAAAGQQACRGRSTTTHAQPNWTGNYNVFAVCDNLNDASRRLRLKAKQMAKKGPLSTGQSVTLAAQELQIESQDALAAALKQMAAATAHEQYEEAARLRDESLSWLEGWHQPVTPNGSRVSSLLHVKREHSRWTGRWFTPGDFLHYDMHRSSSSSNAPASSQPLQMSQLLQDPRYGTPLFEAFVLPADAAATAPSGLMKSDLMSVQGSIQEESGSCSSFCSLVVALQSVQRGMNEVLRVVPGRRPSSGSESQQRPAVRITHQRIMVLVDFRGGTVTAAAVNCGNDSVLLIWQMQFSRGHGNQGQGPAAAAAAAAATQQGSISGPLRPAESGSGAFKVTFTLDWHELDLLRGPGNIQRTGANSFTFVRKPLPADVPLAMCCNRAGNTGSDRSIMQSGHLYLYRVDLQYHAPVQQGAAPALNVDAADCSSSSSSDPDDSIPAWAARIATELQQHLTGMASSHTGSSSSSTEQSTAATQQQVSQLAALLAAAAAGTAPADAVVSEVQQLVSLSEVPLPGVASTAAAGLQEQQEIQQQQGQDVVLNFEKVSGPSVDVMFGGWETQALL